MFGLGIGETIAIIVSLSVILGFIIDRLYKPNASQDIEITRINSKVDFNTEKIEAMSGDIKAIKDNHLVHIQKDMNKMGRTLVRIEEKIKKK